MDDIRLTERPSNNWIALVGGAVCLAGAPLLIREDPIYALLGIVVGPLLLIGGIRGLRNRQPVLEITSDGVRDRRLGSGLIPWSAITALDVEPRAHPQPILRIRPNDPQALRSELSIAAPDTNLDRFFEDGDLKLRIGELNIRPMALRKVLKQRGLLGDKLPYVGGA